MAHARPLTAAHSRPCQVTGKGLVKPESEPLTLLTFASKAGQEAGVTLTIFCDKPLANTDGSKLKMLPPPPAS